MSAEAKYISLYYNLVHPSASDFYKEISKAPSTDMSYLPPWVAPGAPGGGHYPPHMIQQQPVTSHSAHVALTSSPIGSPSHMYPNPPPPPPPPPPASKHQQNNGMHSQPSPKDVPSSIPSLSPTAAHTSTTTSVTQAAAAAAAATAAAVAAAVASHAHNGSHIDHYQAFGHRPMSPTSKAHADIKSEIAGLHNLPELALGLAGPSAFDGKSHRKYVRSRSPGKYPAPEQLSSPVMFSYQGRGRPRKHFTHGTGLPTMVPVTHPSTTACDEAEDEENKPFKCNVCCKGFKLKGGLQQHERTHSTDRPYVCPDCGKLFRQPTHLQQHMRIHTGEKPYDCTFCDKSFRQRTILNQHLRIHTGEKPYICMECGKPFRQKAILDQHYRTHLGEKPYACPHASCRKHFREMASLISHMKCHKDIADPKALLQQAKRMIKEEKLDEYINNHENNISNNNAPPEVVPHPPVHEQPPDRDPNRYVNNGDHRTYPSPPQRSPHSGHHQTQQEPLPASMMPSAQMPMNLFPYPHSIFPATSYVMGSDPRQYHQMTSQPPQSSPVPSRATQ